MSVGAPSLVTGQKKELPVPPGPPFQANSADNGLSIDLITGQIVLGNDVAGILATLLSNREIPMAGFAINFNDVTGEVIINPGFISIDNHGTQLGQYGGNALQVSDSANASQVNINAFFPAQVQGQDNSGGSFAMQANGFLQIVNGNNNQLVFNSAVTPSLALQDASGLGSLLEFADLTLFPGSIEYLARVLTLGDGRQVGNKNVLFLDDNLGQITWGQPGVASWLQLDNQTGIYQMGDLSGVGNSALLQINDTGKVTTLLAGSTNFAQVIISDAADRMQFADNNGKFLDIAVLNKLYRVGDMDGTNNGNFFAVDDNLSRFNITNTALNSVVNINGVDGFTGTVTPVTTITVDGGIVTNVA